MRNRFAYVIFILIIISISPFGNAEYRVFRHKITKTPQAQSQNQILNNAQSPASTDATKTTVTPQAPATAGSQEPTFRIVESTLDPNQYFSYYPLAIDEKLEMIATWRCFGRTDQQKPFCPNPKEKVTQLATNPANTDVTAKDASAPATNGLATSQGNPANVETNRAPANAAAPQTPPP